MRCALQVRNTVPGFQLAREGLQRRNPGGGAQEAEQLEDLWSGNLPWAAAFAASSSFHDSHIHFFTPWPHRAFPGSQASKNVRAVTWAPEPSGGKHLRCSSGGFSKTLNILPSVSENLTMASRPRRRSTQGGNEAAGCRHQTSAPSFLVTSSQVVL